MKTIALSLFLFFLTAGTAHAQDKDWFIESYDRGVVTVLHNGYTYKAECELHMTVREDTITDQHCSEVQTFVGASLGDLPLIPTKAKAPPGVRIVGGYLEIGTEFFGDIFLNRPDSLFVARDTFVITSITRTKPNPCEAQKGGTTGADRPSNPYRHKERKRP